MAFASTACAAAGKKRDADGYRHHASAFTANGSVRTTPTPLATGAYTPPRVLRKKGGGETSYGCKTRSRSDNVPREWVDKRLRTQQDNEVLHRRCRDAVSETETLVSARHLELLHVAWIANTHNEGATLTRHTDKEGARSLALQEAVDHFIVCCGVQPPLGEQVEQLAVHNEFP